MHTIIINTLGSELRQNPLFYLPFQAEQFHWIEKELSDIDQCPQEILAYQSEQEQRRGYHVILLVSLARLESVELKAVRQVHEQILRAYINERFLRPLCQQLQLAPVGVSIVFMLKEKTDGQGDVEAERELDRIFGFTEDLQDLPALIMRDKDGNAVLDVAEIFADALEGFRASLENQRKEPMAERNYALEQLRRHLGERIKSLQELNYIPVGQEHTVTMNCQAVEFAPLTTDWELCCLDMQVNLCEHLQEKLDSETVWRLNLIPHDAQTLRRRILLAMDRVRYLQEEAPRHTFYGFERTVSDQPSQDISSEIWTELCKNVQLPGVQEAYADAQLIQEERDEAAQRDKESFGQKLRRAWLLIGREKKRFDEYCLALEQQYAPEQAAKQEKDILDICANVFGEWRRQVLSRREAFPSKAEEPQMPAYDGAQYEKKLDEAQRKWGTETVQQLEDYTDVRKQAEQIKAKFRKTYRLWPDGEFNATSKFCVYSAVLAGLFLLQMLLPYVGITMGQEGIALSRYMHFGASIVLFVVLYGVGVLVWMRSLCKQLHNCTMELYSLLQDSHRRRRQSIIRAVEIYGSVLPQCTLSYEELQRLRAIHEENLHRKERYNTHMQLLSKAEELLYELRTMLRLQHGTVTEDFQPVGGINYEKPPSHPENVPFYVLMSEKWGRY